MVKIREERKKGGMSERRREKWKQARKVGRRERKRLFINKPHYWSHSSLLDLISLIDKKTGTKGLLRSFQNLWEILQF